MFIEQLRPRFWKDLLDHGVYVSVLTVEKGKNVTTDEAMFYMRGSYGRCRICQMSQTSKNWNSLNRMHLHLVLWFRLVSIFVARHPWFSSMKEVLKLFRKKMFHAFFLENDGAFHQDSASSHTAKMTIDFLKRNRVNYITPAEWMPKSPDAAPMDFGIWGILKRRLQNLYHDWS